MATIATTASARASASPAVRALRFDALVSVAFGATVAAGAPLLDRLLGAPAAFLVPLGAVVVAYGGALALVARAGAPRALVAAVAAGNAVWVGASLVVVAADVLTLTTAGVVVALLQAAAVAGIAGAEARTLRARPPEDIVDRPRHDHEVG
ncbi:MAG: hypothetical protein ICV64_01710 [Thermoleophilia bacterium]|nr:hypothetical protein [Thermoleophilia bacterium]